MSVGTWELLVYIAWIGMMIAVWFICRWLTIAFYG